MKLDPRTVIYIIILASLAMSGGLIAVSRGYLAQVRGVRSWAWATLVQAAGWVVLAVLRGVLPEVVSVVAGQGLILWSLMLYLRILAEFFDYPLRMDWLYGLLSLEMLLLAWFVSVEPNFFYRLLVVCACIGLVMFKSAQVLLSRPAKRTASAWFTASLYGLCGVIMVIRAIWFIRHPPPPDQTAFAVNLINDVSYLSFYVVASMLTFGFVLMCNDRYVRQRQLAEDAVLESSRLFSRLAAQVPGVIYQFRMTQDGRGCMPFASEGIRDIYELSPQDVVEDASSIMQRLHPDDVKAVMASVRLSAQTLQPWIYEYRVVLPRQGLRWRSGHAQPQRLDDGSTLWHGFITDITDQALAKEKEKLLEQQVRAGYAALLASEKRSRQLMSSGLIGVIHGNAQGKLLDANEVFLHMSGYSRLNLGYGALNWLNLTDPLSRDAMQTALLGLGEQGACQFESQLVAADDSVIPVMLGLTPLEGSKDEWVGFVLDLRAQRRIDHLKSEFISVVSHELRTPLTSIRGSLGLLEGGMAGELPPKALHLIGIAHKNSQRLVALVNDILDMEKLASGKMTLHMERQDLVHLAQQAIEANAPYATGFGVSLELGEVPAQAPVLADADRLMQVFANLLSNAAKFSPSGQVVSVRIRDQGKEIRVEVEDRGRGIPQAFREHIFGRFAQADASATRHVEGAGLGLNITRMLVDKMQGKIGFESEEGQGSVFWFSLPKVEPESE